MMDTIHLEAIWRIKQQELFKEILKHAYVWNIQKKCMCMRNKPFPNEIYICQHLRKDRAKKFGDTIKKQFKNALKISGAELSALLN